MQLRPSMRRAAKMRLALAGASGSGKTYSSLLIAYGMTSDWSRVAVIDSENGSADLYAIWAIIRFSPCPTTPPRPTSRPSESVNRRVPR